MHATKFGKSREVPLSPGTVQALAAYAQVRDQQLPRPGTPAFFVSTAGTPVAYSHFGAAFRRLIAASGVGAGSPVRPRVHDMRHSFAVHTLAGWYRAGEDVSALLPRLSTYLGHRDPVLHLLVPVGSPGTAGTGRRPAPGSPGGPAMTALAPTLQLFFTERLARQRPGQPADGDLLPEHLPAAAAASSSSAPAKPPLTWTGTTWAPRRSPRSWTTSRTSRGNTARSRNARLAALRSLFRYAALRHPEHAQLIQQVLAIPQKRFDRAAVSFLTLAETSALLAAPDPGRWEGRRDRALLTLAAQTGLRLAELTGLTCSDIQLSATAHVRCTGQRTQAAMRAANPGHRRRPARLAPRTRGPPPMSRCSPPGPDGASVEDAVERRVAIHTQHAAQRCPSLASKNVTPHTLRHTAAMALLHAGVDTAVIALWLGHADTRSTQIYLHADMTIKERALARTTPPSVRPGRYRPPDRLLAFLESL